MLSATAGPILRRILRRGVERGPVPPNPLWCLHSAELQNDQLQNLLASCSSQVVAVDGLPVKPFTASALALYGGETYDIIFTADQPVANYWYGCP